MDDHYDLVVIGGGPAGEKGAAAAAFWGKRVAVVDRAPTPGGAMVAGVVASKTMREAALYLTGFRQRDLYQVGLGLTPEVAAERLHRRTDDVVRMMADQAADNLRRHAVDFVHGAARLGPAGSRTVVVDDGRVLHADVILVATGSTPFHPPGVPFDDPDVLDSDDAALLDRPLASLVVVGGGAVGCEFASIYTALGADVVLVDSRDRLLPFMDAEIAGELERTFTGLGMRVVHGAGRVSAARDAASGSLQVLLASTGETLTPEKVIFATGRTGNTAGLGLDEAGVEIDDAGRIVVDEQFRTSAPGVYAAGDVIGPPALASASMEQARLAVRWAFDLPLKAAATDTLAPYGVYTVPEAAMVGLTEEAAVAAGREPAVGRARFATNHRAAISGATEGLIKLVFDRHDLTLLGVHVLGDHATELVHLGQAVLHFGGTIEHFVHSTFNVPTLSEVYKYAAYDGLGAVDR